MYFFSFSFFLGSGGGWGGGGGLFKGVIVIWTNLKILRTSSQHYINKGRKKITA